jgi:peptidoglycan/LPS O-acetylase OafA/YrhL
LGLATNPHAPADHRAPVYRPDIDGLRAIAVGLVLAYHAFPSVLAGGFIGVDVFFVISGYLITQLVAGGCQEGTFSLRVFYERRVRRIVPALLLVLVTSVVVGWLMLTPAEFKWLGRSIAWCTPFLANRFMAASGGYFDDASYLNPLLHLWSLGVEEQFYLFWPILLIFAMKRGAATRALGAAIATSLAISIWGAWDAPVVNFYQLSCRTWELAVGGMLAVWHHRKQDFVAVGTVWDRPRTGFGVDMVSFTGLTLIAVGSVILSGDRAFPGWWSVIPTSGAALLIAAGPSARINRDILSRPALIFVGRISYSLYLWHWLLLAFLRIMLGRPPPPVLAAGALALAFVAACASYYLVEGPIRFGDRGRKAVPGLLAALVGVTLMGAAVGLRWIPPRLSGPAIAAIDGAKTDWHYPGGYNSGKRSGFKTWAMPSHRALKALFIGDSHVEQYWPRVAYVVQTYPNSARSAEFATYVGCPPLPGVNAPQHGWSCNHFFDYAMEQALHSDVDTVVFGAFWEAYLLEEFSTDHPRNNIHNHIYSVSDPLRAPLELNSRGTETAFNEFRQVITELVSNGRRVFIILSNPTSPMFNPTSMLSAENRLALHIPDKIGVRIQSIDAGPFETFVTPLTRKLREIAAQSGAKVVDPRDSLCDAMSCSTVTPDGTPLYLDSNHLRPFFARRRAVFLDEMLLGPTVSRGDPRRGKAADSL